MIYLWLLAHTSLCAVKDDQGDFGIEVAQKAGPNCTTIQFDLAMKPMAWLGGFPLTSETGEG